MAQAVVVLAPNTPPDPRDVRAFFVVGATQNLAACQSQAADYKTNVSPTSPDPQVVDVPGYDGSITLL